MFLFSKISLTIVIILIITLIAEELGILNPVDSHNIFMAGLSIQIILLVLLFILMMIKKKQLGRGIKIIRHKIEEKFIKGNTDILPDSIEVTNPRKSSIFKIFVEVRNVTEPPDFGICKTGRGGSKMADIGKHLLNVHAGIIEGNFIFDAEIIVRPDEKINFKFKDDANIKMFFVEELYIV